MLGSCLASSSSIFNFKNENAGAVDEYKDDFNKIVFTRATKRLPYQHRSPQLSYRAQIVNYMKKCASNLKLTHCCLHLAIYLLDIFMDNHSIIKERLLLVANTCILIAAKFEEVSTTIPKIKELNAAVDNVYPVKDYKAMECFILKFYNWYISYPTVAHYVSYFLRALITEEDVKSMEDARSLLYDMHLIIRLLMEKTIDDVHYTQLFLPSKLAAAIICTAREKAGLIPWNLQLEELTQYSFEEIRDELLALANDYYFGCSVCLEMHVKKNAKK